MNTYFVSCMSNEKCTVKNSVHNAYRKPVYEPLSCSEINDFVRLVMKYSFTKLIIKRRCR